MEGVKVVDGIVCDKISLSLLSSREEVLRLSTRPGVVAIELSGFSSSRNTVSGIDCVVKVEVVVDSSVFLEFILSNRRRYFRRNKSVSSRVESSRFNFSSQIGDKPLLTIILLGGGPISPFGKAFSRVGDTSGDHISGNEDKIRLLTAKKNH